MSIRKLFRCFVVAACLLGTTVAWAGTKHYVKVKQIDIHENTIKKIVVHGSKDLCKKPGTKGQTAILYSSQAVNYELITKALMAAYLANKTVMIQTHDTSCKIQYLYLL